ncbi:FEN-1 like endonuclease [Bovine papular stomatitis virus]
MGIKNLKALLMSHGSLKPYEPADDECYPAVYVDGFSVLMTMAYACMDEDEFRSSVEERIQHWTRVSATEKLVVFLDRGDIPIKQPLREQRRRAIKDRVSRYKELVSRADAEDEPADDGEFAEEIRTEKQLKLQRIRFQLSIANHDVVRSLITSTLQRAGGAVEIVYCDGVDAEMVMCTRGREEAARCGHWPLLVTTDQDALLFTSTDRMEKFVSTVSACYRYLPTDETEYLCKLAALTNGCDFFPGLAGISVGVESVRRMTLFRAFNARNAAASLCTRPMRLDAAERASAEAVADIISFIDRYARGDEGIYGAAPPSACCGRAFVRAALYEEWGAAAPPTGLGPVADMIVGLPERREPTPEDVERLAELEAGSRRGRASNAQLALAAELLGYRVADESESAAAAVAVSAKGVFRRLAGTRAFFNPECVEIESESRLLKLL